jgi:hypothetical protein
MARSKVRTGRVSVPGEVSFPAGETCIWARPWLENTASATVRPLRIKEEIIIVLPGFEFYEEPHY